MVEYITIGHTSEAHGNVIMGFLYSKLVIDEKMLSRTTSQANIRFKLG